MARWLLLLLVWLLREVRRFCSPLPPPPCQPPLTRTVPPLCHIQSQRAVTSTHETGLTEGDAEKGAGSSSSVHSRAPPSPPSRWVHLLLLGGCRPSIMSACAACTYLNPPHQPTCLMCRAPLAMSNKSTAAAPAPAGKKIWSCKNVHSTRPTHCCTASAIVPCSHQPPLPFCCLSAPSSTPSPLHTV